MKKYAQIIPKDGRNASYTPVCDNCGLSNFGVERYLYRLAGPFQYENRTLRRRGQHREFWINICNFCKNRKDGFTLNVPWNPKELEKVEFIPVETRHRQDRIRREKNA